MFNLKKNFLELLEYMGYIYMINYVNPNETLRNNTFRN